MLFGNRYEKSLINQYIISPFNGYSIDKNTAFFDLLCDFCSSVAHNGVIFPKGVNKQDHVRVFYSSFALGIILACSKNETQSEEISGGVMRAFANTAKQNGMGQQQILEKMSYILNCYDNLANSLEKATPNKEGAYISIAFLSQVGIKPTQEAIYAMYNLFDSFSAAFSKWDALTTQNEEYRLDEEDRKYVEYIVQNSFGKVNSKEAEAFMKILYLGHKKGKDAALREFDILANEIIQKDGGKESSVVLYKISFLSGLLYPNGVLSKEESDSLAQKYLF